MINFKRYPEAASVRLNFIANVCDGALFAFGMSFVSLVTVFPVLVKKVGGSNLAVGLIPVIWTIGFNIPQIFVANYAGRLVYKKGFMLRTALIQRIPWLLLAVAVFYPLTHLSPFSGLVVIFCGLGLAAIGGSVNLPGWFDLIAKITPLDLRGRLFAYRSILGAAFGIAGGGIVFWVLDTMSFPRNFAVLFLLAFLCMMSSYIFLMNLREDHPSRSGEHYPFRIYLYRLAGVIKQQRQYRNFLIADALLIVAMMADAFYTVNALDKFSLSEGYAGKFLIVMMITVVAANLIFGYIADRLGHRYNLLTAAISTSLICFLAILAPGVEWYYMVFVGSAITISLTQVSRLAIIAELSSEENRAVYIALTNVITAPFILMSILGGALADYAGYNIVFLIAGLSALMSSYWWWQKVEEPRKKVHSTGRSSSI